MLYNGLISYSDTLCTARVRQLRLRLVHVKSRRGVMSACHVSPLAGHIYDQRTLFRILARFWWPMVNKEVYQFIRSCAHFQLINSCSHEAQQLLQTIESDTSFDVVFLDFWVPGGITDQDGSRKTLTCLDCMTGFWISAATGMKNITSDQAEQLDFGSFFVPFGLPKMIVVDVDGIFDGMFKKSFQETLLIPVRAVARGNNKAIINEEICRYLNKL